MNKLKLFFHEYEHILSPLALISGFIFDFLTLQRVDFFWDNFFIVLYLLLSGASIILMDLYDDGKVHGEFMDNAYDFLPFVLQFCFGGLFSAFVVFYSKSASLFTSGAFVLILISLLIGNEFFKKHYSKLVFQTGLYFTAIFSFFIFFLPVLTKSMGALIFILSGIASLLFIWTFIFIVYYLTPERYIKSHKILIIVIFGIYTLINILYFKNIIPPIPLSLKEGDVYHSVMRTADGNYRATGEEDSWCEKFGFSQKLHLRAGEPAYVFSSVFAPTDLSIDLTHDWQYFDEEKNEWISASKISFPVKGGRSEGYRGFSKKENVFPGKWRVDIETDRGQVIGRVRFDIEIDNFEPELYRQTI